MSRSPPSRAARRPVLAVDRAQLAWMGAPDAAPALASCDYLDGPASGLRDAVAGLRPGPVAVVAANDLALHWVQSPPASLASFAELRLVAQARCVHLHGGTPSDWRIAADWRADRPFVCAALPAAVCTLVEQQLAPHGLVARWQSAWSVLCTAMSGALPADGWSALRSPARVLLWHCRDAHVDSMTTWSVDPRQSGAGSAQTALQKMQLEIARTGHAGDGRLHWLDLHGGDDDAPPATGLQPVRLQRPGMRDRVPASEAGAALTAWSLLP